MAQLRSLLVSFVGSEDGATAVEYGLIATLIAVGCLVAMGVLGGALSNLFNTVSERSGNVLDGAGV